MIIRRVRIANYRGIKTLDWRLNGRFIALLGSGDSTKTTILDAMGHALSSRYNVSFTDADFYNCDVTESIEIEVVVTELPDSLIDEQTHGHHRSGIDDRGNLYHDPEEIDGAEECLIIKLTVDESLEPLWSVIRPGESEGERISASQRGQLGFFRLGDQVDAHLRWGRGSALTSLTEAKNGVTSALVEAQRQAREAVAGLSDTVLHEAAEKVQLDSAALGSSFVDLRPGLDPRLGSSSSAIILHEGSVPITQYGLGSRRILSLSIQQQALTDRPIVAIDEIESGLEPHRLANLVRVLQNRATTAELQVFFSTHSPLVVEGLRNTEIAIVRSSEGTTSVTAVPEELSPVSKDTIQGIVRGLPSALLARRVIICEGATEVGFFRYLLNRWDKNILAEREKEKPQSFANFPTSVEVGVALVNGGGDAFAPKRSAAFAELGFKSLLVIDGDVTSNQQVVDEAETAGVQVLRWPTGMALEDVAVTAVSTAGLQAIIDLAAETRGKSAIRQAVQARINGVELEGYSVVHWIASAKAGGIDDSEDFIRQAISAVAQGKKQNGERSTSKAWFKQEELAERFAECVANHVLNDPALALRMGRKILCEFVYAW